LKFGSTERDNAERKIVSARRRNQHARCVRYPELLRARSFLFEVHRLPVPVFGKALASLDKIGAQRRLYYVIV